MFITLVYYLHSNTYMRYSRINSRTTRDRRLIVDSRCTWSWYLTNERTTIYASCAIVVFAIRYRRYVLLSSHRAYWIEYSEFKTMLKYVRLFIPFELTQCYSFRLFFCTNTVDSDNYHGAHHSFFNAMTNCFSGMRYSGHISDCDRNFIGWTCVGAISHVYISVFIWVCSLRLMVHGIRTHTVK